MTTTKRASLAAQLSAVAADVVTTDTDSNPVNVLTATTDTDTVTDTTEQAPSKPAPIAQALLDHGAALAASAEQSSNANQSAKVQGESLASKCRAVIALTDTEACHVIVKAMADVKTMALATLGCAVADATADQLAKAALHGVATFKVLSATLKRANAGKDNAADTHGLLYMAMDRQTLDATVKVITAPTEAELRQALKDDVKALNKALADNQAKADSAKRMTDGADGGEQGEDGHVVIGVGVSSITALAAVLELVKGWRPSELEVAAATFTHMALCERLARLPGLEANEAFAELSAQVDAARLSVTMLTSAYQDEKAAELKARNAAQAQAEAELLALRTANAKARRAELEAEEAALAEANTKMSARMALSPAEPAPVPTTTESPVESTGELVEPNGMVVGAN